jgi:hypothetical protein
VNSHLAAPIRRLHALDDAQVDDLAALLIDCVEGGASVSVLDAVTDGDAARLYQRLGWVRVGDIPGYALFPQGGLCSTTVFYRNLG